MSYFEEPDASQLDEARSKARETKGRLTYDCFLAKTRDGKKVYCAKGYSLAGKRSQDISYIAVLRGYSSSNCKSCPDFDGEPTEII